MSLTFSSLKKRFKTVDDVTFNLSLPWKESFLMSSIWDLKEIFWGFTRSVFIEVVCCYIPRRRCNNSHWWVFGINRKVFCISFRSIEQLKLASISQYHKLVVVLPIQEFIKASFSTSRCLPFCCSLKSNEKLFFISFHSTS